MPSTCSGAAARGRSIGSGDRRPVGRGPSRSGNSIRQIPMRKVCVALLTRGTLRVQPTLYRLGRSF